MYKKSLLALGALVAICISANNAYSQTIFTYSNTPVSKSEFLKAFNKNPDTTGSRADKIREYLSLYINFKLKLQEAYNEKLEQQDDFKYEAQSFKNQLTENYINGQANINMLAHEAFVRSQKDILLSEVFVAAPAAADTAAAKQKIQAAYAALGAGRSFEEVAAAFSTDENIKEQKGTIGYITAFTLPYEVENLVYALAPGGYSAIYHSSIGYHIFKNAGERKAAGKRKIQQILLPVAAGFTAEEKQAVKQKADSLYRLIQNGTPFEEIALQFAGTNGQSNGITTVGVGMYAPAFERIVYSLDKQHPVTAPFESEYGYNIIKLIDVVPVATKEDDVVYQAALQQQVEGDDRLALAKSNLLKQWLTITKYKKGAYTDADLFAYTDSALLHPVKKYKNIDSLLVIFSFPDKKVTAGDWVKYVKAIKESGSAGAQKQLATLLADYTGQTCTEYYRNHIEEYNPAIGTQMKEFNEANLLFAVMDKNVWSKASLDTVALKQYYAAHQQAYTWAPGVSALTVTATSKDVIDSIAQKIKAAPANWRSITGAYSNLLSADSSRFENGQLPVKQAVPAQQGYASTPEQNEAGDAWTFVYVFKVYPQQSPRSFDDAKGMVINDYQQQLETAWLEGLKKKYPVKINEEVVKTLK